MGKKFFIKIVSDPEIDLRKCVVGLACASQAILDGHEVSMFFASNGVKILNSEYLDSINSGGIVPEGMVIGMMKSIIDGANVIYCSTGSQAANGVSKENAGDMLLDGYADWMTWSGPSGVIELSAASDVQLVY